MFLRTASAISRNIPGTIVVTVFATAVTLIDQKTPVSLNIGTSLLTTISMVISLLLVFRTNIAYERYWEGRRLWSTMIVVIRNFSRLIWVQVDEETAVDVLSKKGAINLLLAFAVATKHYLRAEFGTNYDDLRELLAHIPQYSSSAINTAVLEPPSEKRLLMLKLIPCLRDLPDAARSLEFSHLPWYYAQKSEDSPPPGNLPLEISYYLSSYIREVNALEKASVVAISDLYALLNALVECLAGFERVRTTPMPFAYAIHLRVCVWIYCLSLPFQLVNLGYVNIIVACVTSFILLGIESIGAEIEDPFGYDANDLPLDDFCKVLKRELNAITSQPPPNPDDWVFSKKNMPFSGSNASAADLRSVSIEDVRSLLSADTPGESQKLSQLSTDPMDHTPSSRERPERTRSEDHAETLQPPPRLTLTVDDDLRLSPHRRMPHHSRLDQQVAVSPMHERRWREDILHDYREQHHSFNNSPMY
ncbi:uncharacterized protein VTP21DRAFT_11460 [Calcarisporiella thermophila]|uniref:uncharacterized protein n=1 Tax=Calcarisporiella thermophila TaxID=911321 RepID=UPI00374314F8